MKKTPKKTDKKMAAMKKGQKLAMKSPMGGTENKAKPAELMAAMSGKKDMKPAMKMTGKKKQSKTKRRIGKV